MKRNRSKNGILKSAEFGLTPLEPVRVVTGPLGCAKISFHPYRQVSVRCHCVHVPISRQIIALIVCAALLSATLSRRFSRSRHLVICSAPPAGRVSLSIAHCSLPTESSPSLAVRHGVPLSPARRRGIRLTASTTIHPSRHSSKWTIMVSQSMVQWELRTSS